MHHQFIVVHLYCCLIVNLATTWYRLPSYSTTAWYRPPLVGGEAFKWFNLGTGGGGCARNRGVVYTMLRKGKESMPRGGGGLIEISVWICGYGSDGSQYSYSGYSNELMARGFMFRLLPR